MKKVLIITYYWPPSGGGGVQRWLKFAKYLPEYGWQPIIVAPENAEYPNIDPSLIKDISKEAEVIKIPIWEPYKIFKLITGKKKDAKVNSGIIKDKTNQSYIEKISIWIRGNILIPDPRIFWVRPAYKRIKKYLQTNSVDTIITTGPPHSVHLIGLRLKKKLNIKWIADFRDPWSEIDYLDEFNLGKRAIQKQKKLEHSVLTKADKVITVSFNWSKDLEKLGAKRVEVITNGFDEEDFKDFNYHYQTENFTLLYSGFIHGFRNPKFLWDALEELCQLNKDFAAKFELKFFGTIDQSVIEYFNQLPLLNSRYKNGGYISHSELIKEYEKASALLLIQNDSKNALGHIPGKLFEYLASKKPILAIGPNGDGDVKKIIEKHDAGNFCEFNDIQNIKNCITKLFALSPGQNNKTAEISRFSRKNLTQNLVSVLQNLNPVL